MESTLMGYLVTREREELGGEGPRFETRMTVRVSSLSCLLISLHVHNNTIMFLCKGAIQYIVFYATGNA